MQLFNRNIIITIIICLILGIIAFALTLYRINNTEKFNKEYYNYNFKVGHGGIGDFIKYLHNTVKLSKLNNKNLVITINPSLNKFIKVNDKYKNDVDFMSTDIHAPYYYGNNNIISKDEKEKIGRMKIKFNPLEYISFTGEIKDHCKELKKRNGIPNNYHAIHLRMGDKFFDKASLNKTDTRINGIDIDGKIQEIKRKNPGKEFVFFSDNEKKKNEYAEKYNFKILPINVIHTGERQNLNNDETLKDNLAEFLILAESSVIHIISDSGFPMVASWIYPKTKYIKYYE